MADEAKMKAAIQTVIRAMMERVMKRVLEDDAFDAGKHHKERPLYAALVPDEIFKGAHFERRFVTSFGSAWELLALEAARAGLGYGVKGHTIRGMVKTERLRRIQEILNSLEHSESKGQLRLRPDWNAELAYILEGGGEDVPTTIVCDVYAEDVANNLRYAFELKSPYPNSDITKVSKEKILKLHSMEPPQVEGAYFALPYNPYGSRDKYNWTHPTRWFNMREDEAVLIGDEFWDKIGGKGTYQSFISAVDEIGQEYRERIYHEFLNIAPPPNAGGNAL